MSWRPAPLHSMLTLSTLYQRPSLHPIAGSSLFCLLPNLAGHVWWWPNDFVRSLQELAQSTDSASPSFRPAWGQWGYAEWRDSSYQQPSVEIRGLERARHVVATRTWLQNFRKTPHYHPLQPFQMSLFSE